MISRTGLPMAVFAAAWCVATPLAGAGTEPASPQSPMAHASGKLVFVAEVQHLDRPAREPMIVEHPSGKLFVCGYGSFRPRLWTSPDHGASWSVVDVGSEAQGAIGNSDCDLAIAPDGTLYFASMSFDRGVNEGLGIAVGVSRDLGASWTWTAVSSERFDDRPWVEVASDGTAHLVWNDGSGVNHALSRDRGATWTKPARVHGQGGSSHLAVGPQGRVAVRIVPISASGNKFDAGVDLIAVSTDGGITWQDRQAPGRREWAADLDKPGMIRRWVEPLAWDATGALYSLWTEATGVWLGRSLDDAATWEQWRLVETADLPHFPYLVARGHGELAATWFTGAGETLQWHAAHIDLRETDAAPHVRESPPLRTSTWKLPPRPGGPAPRDEGGEYLAVTFLRDGGLAVVSPIQDWLGWRFGFSCWKLEEHP